MVARALRLFLQYGAYVLLAVVFVWLAVKDITQSDWLQMKASMLRARHWLILPVVGLLMLSHYLRALRWRLLMQSLGYRPSIYNTWAAVMVGYLVNAGVPRLGEVVKCTLLAKYEKVRADRLVGTIVVERAVDLLSLVVVFLLALVFEFDLIQSFQFRTTAAPAPDGFLSRWGLWLAAGVVLVLVIVWRLFFPKVTPASVAAVVRQAGGGFMQGLLSVRHMKRKGEFIIHSIAIWVLYWLSTTLGIFALRETAHLGGGAGLITLAVGSVAMVVSPGGIGAYPVFVAKLMKAYGMDETTTGLGLGWLLWAVQTLIVLIAGALFLAGLSYFNRGKNKPEIVERSEE